MVQQSGGGVREGLSSVTKGTLFLLVSTLLLVGLTFASRVLIIRTISTSDWSSYSFGLALTGVLAAIGSLGLPSAVARSLPYTSRDDERRTIVRGSLWIGGVSALAVSVLLFAFANAIGQALGSPGISLSLHFFPIAVGASILSGLIASVFQGYEDVTPNAVFIQILSPALFVVFLAACYAIPPGTITLTDALVAYAAANAVVMGLLVAYLYRRLPKHLAPGPPSPPALPRLLRFTAPLFVVGVMGTIVGSGDTLVLGVFHPSSVGTYTASLTLARLVAIGIGAAAYIFLPVASRFVGRGDTTAVAVTYVTVTKWLILISLPLFLLFFFLPSGALTFVYGSGYAGQVVPLQITVLGAFATTILGPASTAQIAFGQTRFLATNAVVCGCVDVALAFALAPAYGFVGAAIAWAVANSAYTALSLIQLGLLTGVHPFRRHFVVPFVVTAIPLGVVLGVLHPSVPLWALPVLAIGIVLLFVAVVLVSRSIDEGDRLLLEAVERMFGRPLPTLRRIGRYALRSRSP